MQAWQLAAWLIDVREEIMGTSTYPTNTGTKISRYSYTYENAQATVSKYVYVFVETSHGCLPHKSCYVPLLSPTS
jgi:hypothetical protein